MRSLLCLGVLTLTLAASFLVVGGCPAVVDWQPLSTSLSSAHVQRRRRRLLGLGWRMGVGTTAAGSYAQGMASVINAAGQANLANSAAANNWENAYSMDLNNRLQATNTYFEQRRINREAVAEERGPRATAAELARFAKEAAPARLNASQLDPVTGEIGWPTPLRAATFDAAREKVDKLFAMRESDSGAVGPAGYRRIRDSIEELKSQFAKKISDYAPQVYVDTRKFLESLQYEAGFAG